MSADALAGGLGYGYCYGFGYYGLGYYGLGYCYCYGFGYGYGLGYCYGFGYYGLGYCYCYCYCYGFGYGYGLGYCYGFGLGYGLGYGYGYGYGFGLRPRLTATASASASATAVGSWQLAVGGARGLGSGSWVGCRRLVVVWLAAIEAEDASADAIAGREDAGAIIGGDVTPGGGHPKPRPRLVERTQRGRKAKPLITRGRARALRKIESHATQRAPNLTRQIPIPPIDRINERPSLRNDLKNTIQELSL